MKAQALLASMREQQDGFRQATDSSCWRGGLGKSKDKLEQNWDTFEANVHDYMGNVGEQVEQRRRTFQARADAQAKAWRESADKLGDMVTGYASSARRAELESENGI
jgi:hypothetical protein